jgi:type I restriction enzyme S subunit
VSTDCLVTQPKNNDELFLKYIYYFLSGNIHILENGFKGAGLKHISKGYLSDIKIPLPPLDQQKKIAAILDAADAYRQKTKELNKKYDELTQSLFLDMFGNPVTNPKGWELKTVEKVCEKIYGGGTPPKSNPEYYEGDIPWVTPKDMKFDYLDDSIDHINQIAVDNSSAKLIPKGSVLMVIRSGILKHSLPVAINTEIVTVNQDLKAYIPNTSLTNSVYLKSFFDAVSSFLLSKVRAVTADNIEFKQIKELSFICPPIDLQNQFEKRAQAIEAQKAQAQASLAQAEDLFNSLLQRAFKGELTN